MAEYGIWLNLILIIFFGSMIFVLGLHFQRDMKRFQTFNNEQIQTTLALMLSLVLILFVMLRIHNIDERIYRESNTSLLFFLFFGGFPLLMMGIMIFTNLLLSLIAYPKFIRHGTEISLRDPTKRNLRKLDLIRKFFHIMMLVGLSGFTLAMANYLRENWYFWDVDQYWGVHDGSAVVVMINNPEATFTIGQMFIFGVFYGTTCVTLMFEATRLSDHVQFPLVAQVQRTLRKKELNTFASHTHNAVGYLFASLVMPPNCLFAALCLFSLGDTFAALIGINWGKHKIRKLEKSWEGTVAGFLISLFSGYLFVGWIWSLAGAVVFVMIDLITPKLLKVSDNLLIPLVMVVVYYGLKVASIPAEFPIASFIGVV